MEQVQPGCFLCAVITQPLVAARISAQNETYLRWGGWGRTALGIAGESPQPCEDLERKARPEGERPKYQNKKISKKQKRIIYLQKIRIMTLHEAMIEVLKKKKSPMTTKEIAEQLNQNKLYEKKDKSPIKASQIQIRAYNYKHLFVMKGNNISLKHN